MRIAVNGVHLNVEQAGSGPAVLLLHGFTGSSATWRSFQDRWAGFRTIAVDVIGHGESDSPPDASRYTMSACIDDLTALLDQLSIEKAGVLGYSMGGRIALRFALARRQRLWGLVLESASPGIAAAEDREARVRSDAKLAENLERDGLEAFIDYWQSISMWASQARLPREKHESLRRQRLHNSATGLANSLRGMGAGADEDVFDRVGELTMPSLLIAGALDARYAETSRRMAAAMSHAELRIVENAGHAVHFEEPDQFAEAVTAFLRRHAPSPATSSKGA